MLLTRILTALVLAPAVLAAVFFLDARNFALTFLALTTAAAWEWGQLCGLGTPGRSRWPLIGYVVGYAGFAAAVIFPAPYPAVRTVVLLLTLLLWAWLAVRVLRYQAGAEGGGPYLLDALTGYLALAGALLSLVVLREAGGALLLLFCLLPVWLGDIGAYFVGRAIGQHKLAPAVSPGKSWEGAVGGILLATAGSLVALSVTPLLSSAWLWLLPAGVAVSVFGDLFESTLKRRVGAKDSGRLLPGHGGLLDRIDALLPTLPFFALTVPLFLPA